MAFAPVYGCLVCEGVRFEVGGKFTLVGFFGITPHVYIRIGDFTLPVSFSFFYLAGEAAGFFRTNVRIVAASGQIFMGAEISGELKAGPKASNFHIQFSAILPGPGQYKLVLVVDGSDYHSTTFELLQ